MRRKDRFLEKKEGSFREKIERIQEKELENQNKPGNRIGIFFSYSKLLYHAKAEKVLESREFSNAVPNPKTGRKSLTDRKGRETNKEKLVEAIQNEDLHKFPLSKQDVSSRSVRISFLLD